VLFDGEDNAAAEASRAPPVAEARVPGAARKKAHFRPSDTKHGQALSVHGFRTLLANLGTSTKNTVFFYNQNELAVLATPTAMRRRALGMLGRTRRR
jgi:hypothetical protein